MPIESLAACCAVPPEKSYLLLNHGPVTLVTSADGERRNVMAAAWAMPLDFSPAKVLLVVDKSAYTRELIDASGEFALNLPLRSQAGQVLAVGSCSGRDGNKFAAAQLTTFAAAQLTTFAAAHIAAPLIAGCAAWLECRVIREPHNERTYDLLIAEVLAAHADPALFSDGQWHFPDTARTTLHYQSGGRFFATGEAFVVPGAED